MGTYKVHARSHGRGAEFWFEADSDIGAVMNAAAGILYRAANGPAKTLWAKGTITLMNPDGDVIHTMPAKP